MLLPSPWHKMVFNIIVVSCMASDLHKLPKWGSVTILLLWYIFHRYIHLSPGTAWKSIAQKCNILLSIQIHISEIQWGLLSIDTSIEGFLEIGASDLFVSTWRLQEPSYKEVWETYSSLSIGLGKQIIQILLIVGFLEWLASCITLLSLPVSNFKLIKQVYCHSCDQNHSLASHKLGDALLLRCRSTLFLQEYNIALFVACHSFCCHYSLFVAVAVLCPTPLLLLPSPYLPPAIVIAIAIALFIPRHSNHRCHCPCPPCHPPLCCLPSSLPSLLPLLPS